MAENLNPNSKSGQKTVDKKPEEKDAAEDKQTEVDQTEADTVLISSQDETQPQQQPQPQQPQAQQPSKKLTRKPATIIDTDTDSDGDDVVEIVASEDSDFCPSPKKKIEKKKAPVKHKPRNLKILFLTKN